MPCWVDLGCNLLFISSVLTLLACRRQQRGGG